MTTALPTARLLVDTPGARARAVVACPSCRREGSGDEPFCARCGSRVLLVSEGRRPADVAATRSLQFAGLLVLSNAVIGAITFGVVVLVSDAARLVEAALLLEGIKLLVVGVLATTTIRFGLRGLRDTADGRLRRRGWAVAGLVTASIFALLVAVSFAAVLALSLMR